MSANGGRNWGTALIAAVAGSVLTAGLLLAIAPRIAGERLVRDTLRAHPDILVEAGDALRDRQYAPTLAAYRSQIETPYFSSWKGAARPTAVLAYYYDYSCTYCRRSNPDIERLLAEDKGLRVVYRELPILGPASVAAARVALTASKAGHFAAYHDAMYAEGQPSPDTIARAAAAAGVPAVPTDAAGQDAELKKNFAVASQLGATGTPLFVIGDRVMNSAVGYDMLKQAIAAARAKG